MANSYDLIYAVVRQIPVGKVAPYGQVADLAGIIGKPRVVGYALYKVAKGEISTSAFRDGSDDLQRVLLEDEGIEFEGNKINLSKYRWQPPPEMIDAIDFGKDE